MLEVQQTRVDQARALAPREGDFDMGNIDWWVWLIIAAVLVAIVVLVVVNATSTRRKENRRDKAADIRNQVRSSEVEARRREADALAARADAEAARLTAEGLDREAEDHEQRAAANYDEANEKLVEADRIDPDIDTGHGSHVKDIDAEADRTAAGDRRTHPVAED